MWFMRTRARHCPTRTLISTTVYLQHYLITGNITNPAQWAAQTQNRIHSPLTGGQRPQGQKNTQAGIRIRKYRSKPIQFIVVPAQKFTHFGKEHINLYAAYATGYKIDSRRLKDWKIYFSPQKHIYGLWEPSSFPFSRHLGLLPRKKSGRDVKKLTCLYPNP